VVKWTPEKWKEKKPDVHKHAGLYNVTDGQGSGGMQQQGEKKDMEKHIKEDRLRKCVKDSNC
jgi:hypothetical protein